MNRVILGILCGIVFRPARRSDGGLRKAPGQIAGNALTSIFQPIRIGFLAANVSLRIHPAISGALVGLLISLPDAFAMKSYAGILGTGLIFGALAGWAAKTSAT